MMEIPNLDFFRVFALTLSRNGLRTLSEDRLKNMGEWATKDDQPSFHIRLKEDYDENSRHQIFCLPILHHFEY